MFYSPITQAQREHLLQEIGVPDIDALFADMSAVGQASPLDLPEPLSELELKQFAVRLAGKNKHTGAYISFMGGGSYDHFIPSVVGHVISRSEFYTSYTPYQPEMSQGTLRSIFEFQTMICELTGLGVANASVYDGASALAEACVMTINDATKRTKVLLPSTLPPSYREVLDTYLLPKSVTIQTAGSQDAVCVSEEEFISQFSGDFAAVVLSYPDFFGNMISYDRVISAAKENGIAVIMLCDPIALALFKSPGELGADIAVGEGQPLGIPTAFGGPYLGFMAASEKYLRLLPGRIVGQTHDKNGTLGYVLTFQTREQHIKREKSLSNICTNQGLLALAATVYMAYMGPHGLRRVAELCYKKTNYLKTRLASLPGVTVLNTGVTFREFVISLPCDAAKVGKALKAQQIFAGIDMGRFDKSRKNQLLIAVTEKRSTAELDQLAEAIKGCL